METATTSAISTSSLVGLITPILAIIITSIVGKFKDVIKLSERTRDIVLPTLATIIVGIGYKMGFVPAENISQLIVYLSSPVGLYTIGKKVFTNTIKK